jgi:hypothetical protein
MKLDALIVNVQQYRTQAFGLILIWLNHDIEFGKCVEEEMFTHISLQAL